LDAVKLSREWSCEALPPQYLDDPALGLVAGLHVRGGRRVWVQAPSHAPRVAVVHFEDVCGRALGAVDYAGLFERAEALAIREIPRLGRERLDSARRFVTLVDEAYEAGAVLVLEPAGG